MSEEQAVNTNENNTDDKEESTETSANTETASPNGGATEKPNDAPPDKEELPKKETIVAAKGEEKKPDPERPYWPEDWREKTAERWASGDKKVYEKELKRLKRIADPSGLHGMWRELEGKFSSGDLIKKPGKDATEEEVAAYHKALGVPEKPEDYFKNIKLNNGAEIGEADKPLADEFAQAVHKTGATQEFVNAALNWYYGRQEEQAAALDEADDTFATEAERALKQEYGNAYKRNINSIAPVFNTAPGGTDIKNENSLFARLMGGRTADGRIIGNDPDMVRWLVSIAHEINPAATVVETGNQSGQTIDNEIAAIEKRMREDRVSYFKDEAAQSRLRDLYTARDKIREKSR